MRDEHQRGVGDQSRYGTGCSLLVCSVKRVASTATPASTPTSVWARMLGSVRGRPTSLKLPIQKATIRWLLAWRPATLACHRARRLTCVSLAGAVAPRGGGTGPGRVRNGRAGGRWRPSVRVAGRGRLPGPPARRPRVACAYGPWARSRGQRARSLESSGSSLSARAFVRTVWDPAGGGFKLGY